MLPKAVMLVKKDNKSGKSISMMAVVQTEKEKDLATL